MKSLIFHIGYGKTATTFLQDSVFSYLDDVFYFGKYKGKFDTELQDLFYSYFVPSHISNETFTARLKVKQIGNYIVNAINNSNKKAYLFSNESILGYASYNVEWNLHKLKKLVNYVKLHSDNELSINIIITIREQKDFLKSSYAFSFGFFKDRYRTLNSFVQYGLEKPYDYVFGGAHYYYLVKDVQELFGDNVVKVLVYERMEKDIEGYLEDILRIIGSKCNTANFINKPLVNVNSSDKGHALRVKELGFLTKLSQIKKKYFPNIRTNIGNTVFYKRFNKYLDKTEYKSIGYIKDYTYEQKAQLDNLFRHSNNLLNKEFNLNLEKYGYSL